MSTFDSRWLQMREPYDHQARSVALVDALAAALPNHQPVRLLDMACGTGSGTRFVAPKLPAAQSWVLMDHDPALIDAIPDAMARWATAHGRSVRHHEDGLSIDGWTVHRVQADVRDFSRWPEEVDAVLVQALLDLVSGPWLEALARWIRERELPLLAALTVDGRVQWSPPHPDDPSVHAAFVRHQHTDRGFGPSPGPGATEVLADHLRRGGYHIHTARADWQIPATDPAMLRAMVEGFEEAASEMHDTPATVRRWCQHRLQDAATGRLSLRVGHLDLLALPPSTPQQGMLPDSNAPERDAPNHGRTFDDR